MQLKYKLTGFLTQAIIFTCLGFLMLLLLPQFAHAETCGWLKEYDVNHNLSGWGGAYAPCATCTTAKPGDGYRCYGRQSNITPAVNASMPSLKNPIEEMKIKIPGMIARPVICTGESKKIMKDGSDGGNLECSVPWIGDYVAGVMKYLLGAAGILAVMVMMFGGMSWMISAGNSQAISEAKAWIGGGVTGLIILVCAVLILNEVNPELTKMKSINLKYADEMESDAVSGGDARVSDPPPVNVATGITKIIPTPTNNNLTINSRNSLVNGMNFIKKLKDSGDISKGKNNCTIWVHDVCKAAGLVNTVRPANGYAGSWYDKASPIPNGRSSLKAGDIVAYKYTGKAYTGHVYMCYNDGCTTIFENGEIKSESESRAKFHMNANSEGKSEARVTNCNQPH